MSYIRHSLSRNETILYRARFPWFYAASAWALPLLSIAGGIGAYVNDYGWLAAGSVVLGLVLFVAIMMPIWTTEIGVTNQRLILKRGLVWRTTQELQLRAVEEVNLQQGVLGRLFDFGRLELHGTGVDDITLPTLADPVLADPVGLRKALQDGMAAAAMVPAAPASVVAADSPSHSVA